MNRVGSKPLWSVFDIRHSRSKFGSKFISLNYLHMQKKRFIAEQEKIDTRRKVLQRRLQKIEREMNERIGDLL